MSDDINEYGLLVPKRLAEDLVAEVARLKAEVERLTKLFADTERLMLLDGEYEAAKVGTYANLKAEIERLTKLCQATSPNGFIHIRDIKHHPLMGPALEKRENAAKEGKQP